MDRQVDDQAPVRAAATDTAMKGHPPRGRRFLPALLPVLFFVALAGLFAIALRKGDPSKVPSALIGRQAPEVTLPPIDGLTRDGKPFPSFTVADLAKGTPSVVNFWASWCLPCVEEHPQLVRLQKETGVPIYGVNHKDQPSNARQFLARHGNPFTAIGADPNGRASIEWGVYGMPETFVVDGQGRVVYKHVGPISAETLEGQVMPALMRAGYGR